MQPIAPNLEILAPAGSMESLIAAVRSGADAVYLGSDQFSARGNAQNFHGDALREAVEYCHAAGVAVHLAVNTVLFDKELPQALDLIAYACRLPVDGLIVQDWGLFRLIRQAAPEMPLHCSTQMSIHTPMGAQLMAEQGASRVVLSRELSLGEIREISAKTQVELEHFVHGALCMCVSGQCYFSAMLGSRSGNRGLCAQPCRLPFQAKGGTGYDLSLKDLSMISRIGALRDAGVYSCKIEGRMKRPEYVAAATAACRYSADGQPIPPDLLNNLESVFSRSGFTSGYPDGTLGVDMFGTRTYEDVTSASKSVFSALRQLYQNETPRVPVSMSVNAKIGEPVTLKVTDSEGFSASALGPVVETATHRPMDPQRCEAQLRKTGGTVFRVEQYHSTIDPQAALPVSALNALRRDALEQLEQQRRHRPAIAFSKNSLLKERFQNNHCPAPMALRSWFSRVTRADQIPDSLRNCQLVFIPLFTDKAIMEQLLARDIPVGVALPRGMFGKETAVQKALETAAALGIRHGWTGNIGGVPLLKNANMEIHGGFSLNVTNTQSLRFLQELGLSDTELSCELTLKQAAGLGGDFPRGLVLYGRLPLMLTRNCPAANHPDGCRGCENHGGTRPAEIVDRKGTKFPIQCTAGCSTIFNSVPTVWSDQLSAVSGQDFGTLQFTVENSVEIDDIFTAYQTNRHLAVPFTRGLYRRGID